MSRTLLASLVIASAVAAVGCESDDNRSARSSGYDNSQPVSVESYGARDAMTSASQNAYQGSYSSRNSADSGVMYQNSDGTPWRGYSAYPTGQGTNGSSYSQSGMTSGLQGVASNGSPQSYGSTPSSAYSQSGSAYSQASPQYRPSYSGQANASQARSGQANSGQGFYTPAQNAGGTRSGGSSAGGYGSDQSAAGNYATSDWRSGTSTYNNTGRGADTYAERSGTAVTASERQGPGNSNTGSSSSNTGSPGQLSGQPADNTNSNWTNRNSPGSYGTGTNSQSVQNSQASGNPNSPYNSGPAASDNNTNNRNNNMNDTGDNARTAAERMGMGPVSPADKMFLVALSGANQAEIDTARLALDTSKTPQIRQIAQQMIQDHQQAQQQLQDLARRKDVDIDTSAPQAARSAADALDELDGTQFDQQYLAVNRAAHQATIAQVQYAAQNAQDPDVRNLAQQLLPKLRGHVQDLNRAAGQGGTNMPGMNTPSNPSSSDPNSSSPNSNR